MKRHTWERSTLGDECQMYQPKTISKKEMIEDGEFPVYGANGLIGRYDRYNHEGPQLLITCRGATCGTINRSEPKSWITGNSMVIQPDMTRLDDRYLEYFLQQPDCLASSITGAAQPQITRKSLSPIEIVFPPLSEQRRLVGLLDAAFAGLATATAHTQKNLQNARELFGKSLNQTFSDIDASQRRFGDVCDFVRGPFGGSLKKSIFVNRGYAVYEQQHAIGNQFESIRYRITQEKFESMLRFQIKPGDLIMSCSGTMGRVAVVPSGIEPGVINQALLKLSPRDEMSSEYLGWWMKSDSFFGQLEDRTKGVAIKNVASVKVLKNISLPTPPRVKQRDLVRRIEAMYEATGRLAETHTRKLAALEELKRSILQRAFRGELSGDAAAAATREAEAVS